MKTQSHEEPRIVAAAERQMQAWARTQETADRVVQGALRLRLATCGRTYVAVSREAGTNADEIARLLGQELGWEVLGRTLLDRVAERLHEPRSMLNLVDETQSNWAFDVLGACMDGQIVTHERYVACLTRVVRAAGRRGKVVIVGRGAQFLLPRERGLAVRLVASEKFRVQQLMRRRSLDEPQARRLMVKVDHDRGEFVSRHFHHDTADPHVYDLVLNVEALGPAATVDQIVAALCR